MTTITMPQLGESVTEGTILQWFKQPGDPVALDDALCEIETEKVTAELPSPYEGTMGEILVPQGETVQVGDPLCEVVEGVVAAAATGPNGRANRGGWSGGPMAIPPDEDSAVAAAAGIASGFGSPPPGPAAHAIVSRAPAAPASQPGTVHRSPENRERFHSPAVLRLAGEHGLDLGALAGSGIGGRVTRKDVEQAIAASPVAAVAPVAPRSAPAAPPARPTVPTAASGRYETVPLTATRRTIAENLKRSNLEAPQAWTMVEADVTDLVALRNREKDRFLADEGVALTLLPYFVAAVCEALHEFPMLNARWEGEELRRFHSLDIGIAVASESGLVVPVIHGAGDLNVAGLARRIADLAERSRTKKLRIEDIEGGTFTVNNTGAFGSIASKPIVNHPQVAIVTMERAVKRATVLENDAIAIRWMMNLCLSFDHRAMDGLEAGGFLASLKRRVEAIA